MKMPRPGSEESDWGAYSKKPAVLLSPPTTGSSAISIF